MQINAKWAAAAVVVAVVGIGGFWLSQRADTGGGVTLSDTQADRPAGPWSLASGGNTVDAPPPPTLVDPAARTPAQTRDRLFKQGSLAGTEPSGEWCVSGQLLKPCHGLRGRFEYYILGIGEVTIGEIRALILDEARSAHGDKLADEIIAVFDKYWQVRTHEWRNKFNQNDRSTWMPVFEEQRSVRRQILGHAWAEAFFGPDEKHFQNYYAQLESGQPPPPDPGEPVPQMEPGKDPAAVRAERVARYGEAAAARLDAVDAKWADWDRRLAAARSEWQRLQGAANLSEPQKKAEMDRYVAENFEGKDQIRVRALLRL